jgi:hypothetical protein
MKTRFTVERRMDASADVVNHCLADHRGHHRPGGFLTPVLSKRDIVQGGVSGRLFGAGVLAPVSRDELQRLEDHAEARTPDPSSDTGAAR